MQSRSSWTRALLSLAGAMAVLGAVLLVPAWAVEPPTTTVPVIDGVAREGATLTASATWTGSAEPTVEWQWLRCARTKGRCPAIPGATSNTYQPTAADVGSVLRVRITVTVGEESGEERSDPTAVVTAAPPPDPAPEPTPEPSPEPTPEPSPEPTPEPSPEPSPSPSPSPSPTPAPAPSPEPGTGTSPGTRFESAGDADPPPTADIQPVSESFRVLRPFPLVRVRGRLTRRGARVTLLTVRAPRGVKIAVRCRGRSCPVRRVVRAAAVSRLRQFERKLRAGTRIDIRVTRAGYVGKWTTLRIRRGAPPSRRDRCVEPNGRRPIPCPDA